MATPESFVLDLDTIERPADEVVEPFTFKIQDRVLTITDPRDNDWQDVLEVVDPEDFLRVCMTKEDRLFLYEAKLPTWKFGKLIESFQKHYGIDEDIEKAQRQNRRR